MNVLILFYFLSVDECEGRPALKTDQLFPALEKKILQTSWPDSLLCQGRQGKAIGCFSTFRCVIPGVVSTFPSVGAVWHGNDNKSKILQYVVNVIANSIKMY